MLEDNQTLQCPYCGESFAVQIDITVPEQSIVTDCEICCRPMEVDIECDRGEITRIDIKAS